MFHLENGIYFRREADGGVTILRKERDDSPEEILVKTDAGGWCSAVLSVSAFDERPGDWYPFMDHHMGRKDMLAGQRGGY